MSVYDNKPERFLERIASTASQNPRGTVCCAGFELEEWRCAPLAYHLVEWLPDYALVEDELLTHHGNAFVKLRQAAVRVYTSDKYKSRGEAGEIALHAICRDFFNTIPISPRVFFKSASNDVIKSFDMLHARFPEPNKIELWVGESKLFKDPNQAITSAINSIKSHIDKGFLTNQKLLLGPQIPKSTPHYDDIIKIFKAQASLDKFLSAAVFVVGILCESDATKQATSADKQYVELAKKELSTLAQALKASGLCSSIRLTLIYVPLADKKGLVDEFDKRLKGLQ